MPANDSALFGEVLARYLAPSAGNRSDDPFATEFSYEQQVGASRAFVERERSAERRVRDTEGEGPDAERYAAALEESEAYRDALAAISSAVDEVEEMLAFVEREYEHFGGRVTTFTLGALRDAREAAERTTERPSGLIEPLLRPVALIIFEEEAELTGAWLRGVEEKGLLSEDDVEELRGKYARLSARAGIERESYMAIGRGIRSLRELRSEQ